MTAKRRLVDGRQRGCGRVREVVLDKCVGARSRWRECARVRVRIGRRRVCRLVDERLLELDFVEQTEWGKEFIELGFICHPNFKYSVS